MTNIHDRAARDQRRQKFLPLLEFCCRVAIFQIEHEGHFIIENPASSALWYTRCSHRLLSQRGVTYGTLDMCSFGMKDPNGYYYNKPTSLLHNFDEGVLAPVFKRCSNKLGGEQHQHQPLEGSAPGFGSRTKLAQVYPYRFCSKLIRCLLPLGSHHGLFHAQTTVVVDLLGELDIPGLESLLTENTDRGYVHFSESDSVTVKDFYVRRLMNRVNSLPKGHEYNPWSESLHIAHDVSHMRQIFAPTMALENATILRGTFEQLKIRYRHTAGVLFLWRKKDTTKVYIQSHPFDDLSKLVESNWSCVFFWNSDGRVPSKPARTPVTPDTVGAPPAPPPGLDPDEYMTPTGPDMPGDIPGDPFTPGDFFTPGDSPDPSFTPSPGQPPPEHPFPPFPGHSPPSQPDTHLPGELPDTPPSGPQPPSQFPPSTPAATVPPIPPSFLPLTPVQPDTPVVPTLVVPPSIPDEPMIFGEKRPTPSPVSDGPSTKARPTRPVQMPASPSPPSVPPSNHLGGDDQLVFSPPVVRTPAKKRKPEDDIDDIPEFPEEEDAGDPDAQPSGPNLPIADDDDGQPVSPESPEAVIVDSDIPDDVAVDVEEEEEEEEDDVDSDETIDYNDLYVDENSWSWLSAEQKLCSNTGSFTVPRYIDGSPVDLKTVPSYADFVTPSSYMAQKKRQLLRKNYADIREVYSGITEEDKAFLTLYQSQEDKFSYLVGKKRKEATQQEKRQFAKQFLEAKQAECKSWFDNDVFELVDMRKLKIRNYVAGRWVLTIKKDKDGNFLKCKARWVLKGFQDRQKDTQQTDSPAASRSGFRCATQFAANCQWDLYHMDLKTAFLQGEAYDETRDSICQIPSECGYPPHIGAKMKKSAYGLNDAPRRWWQAVDKALLSYGLVPTRADRCTYILYGDKMSSKDASLSRSFRKTSTSNDPVQDAIDMLLDPVAQNNAQGRRPHGFICLHVDDLFMAGDKVFADKVLASIRKDFNVGSEDKNDIMFVGQRIKCGRLMTSKGHTSLVTKSLQ